MSCKMEKWMFRPPVLVGERVVWLGSGTGLPQGGIVRWIGKLPEMGPDWTVGMELDNPLPYGGIDGTWGNRQLFTCAPKHGLLVPIAKIVPEYELFKWPCQEKRKPLRKNENDLLPEVHPEPPVRHRVQARKGEKVLQQKSKEPVINDTSSKPQPAARRRKLQRQRKTLTVIQEPAETESDVNSDYKTLPVLLKFSKATRDKLRHYSGSLKSLKSSKTYKSYRTCRSGDYSEYQWYDAKDDQVSDFQDCYSNFYEPVEVCENYNENTFNELRDTLKESLSQSAHNEVEPERMSYLGKEANCNGNNNWSTHENGKLALNGNTSNEHKTIFSNVSPENTSGSRKEKSTSGFFSFLKWFRKGKAGDEEDDELEDFAEGLVLPSVPSTPKLIRTQSSSCGSIDTLFSTATVNSFAFVTPTAYRPFGTAETPEKWIAIEPDTETYKKRLFQRDKLREHDKNLTLKKKYKLFGSDTLIKGGAVTLEINSKNERIAIGTSKDNPNSPPGSLGSSFGRKKRRAPLPPINKIGYSDYSLPNTLEHKNKGVDKIMDIGDSESLNKSRHKRSASESCKDKKAGAYCHVKGKRKAPAPPDQAIASNIKQGNLTDKNESQVHSFGRKKRPAPPPPVAEKNEEENAKRKKGVGDQVNANKGKLSVEEKERLIANIDKLRVHANRNSLGSPPSSPVSMHLGIQSRFEQVVSNDSLKLEKGVLKPTKEMPKLDSNSADNKVAPVSPRPWYKRSLSSKESSVGSVKKDLGKSSDKKRDREKEMDWLIEGGIPRGNSTVLGASISGTNNKFNIFSRLDRSEERKREGDKRKSQISMLANISELDREAAAIVQKEQAREQAIMAANDAKFYSHPHTDAYNESSVGILQADSVLPTVEVPKRSSARELISLFNAISNVTKVTVNSTFFSKDGSKFISKEGVEKRFSYAGESFKTTEERVVIQRQEVSQKRQSMIINTDPVEGTSSGIVRQTNAISYDHSSITGINILSSSDLDDRHNKKSSVTIEEVEDNSGISFKGKQMYKGNKSRVHHSPSPSIPTIAEQSETTSLATTPGSTMNPHSNRESTEINIEDIRATSGSVITKPLQESKQVAIWACPRCTLENPRWKLICDACGQWRPSLTDEKFQNLAPCTTIPATSSELKPMQKKEIKKPVNWEEELKRYFPKENFKKLDDAKVDQTKESEFVDKVKCENKTEGVHFVEKNTKETQIAHINDKPSVSQKNHNEEQIVNKSKSSGSSVMPPTFIGGRNHNEKQLPQKVVGKSDLITPTAPAEPDMQEIRKARLAFFKQTADKEKSTITNNYIEECDKAEKSKPTKKFPQKLNTQFQEDDKQRLKEMLKEMKNSLPKRPKTTTVDSLTDENSKTSEIKVVQAANKIKEINNQNNHNGAIKKIPMKQTKNITSKENIIPNKVDAAIISKDYTSEDVQHKKIYGLKPLKVSTSAQTNSVIRKIEANDKEEIKQCKEPIVGCSATLLPATVEELSDSGIKEGVLVTSLTKKGRKIGKGTFELIRARDFASIEATKTGNETGVIHVYANYPTSSNNIPTKQSEKDKNIKDHSVINFLQPTNEKCSEESSIEEGNSERSQKVVMKGKNISTVQSSRADVGVSSPDLELQRKNCSSGTLSVASNLSLASSSGDNSEVERLTAQLTLPKGLADFKADLKTCPPEKNMNTLAVNRLLRRLEAAIAGGQHHQAAGLARDLARLKISCSVTRQRRTLDSSPLSITVDMYVEDKVSHQGPIPLQVTAGMTVAQLKEKVQKEFEIPAHVQRWILGKVLASDDSKTLADHNVNSDGCPMFLYLVAPDIESDGDSKDTNKEPRLPEPLQLQPAREEPNDEKPGGWYYNYEEDHYSFCEESESDNADDEASSDNAQVKNGREKTNDQTLTVVTNVKVETFKDEESEEVDEEEEEDEEEETEDDSSEDEGATALPVKVTPSSEINKNRLEAGTSLSPKTTSASTSQKTFQPIKAVMQPIPSAPLLQKVDTDNQELPAKRETKTDTLKLGWICPVCTLVNSPTRPGCAACTTERPIRYVVPVEYRANEQELQRMQREQELDNDMEQAVAKENDKDKEKQTQHYLQLVDLDKTDLVPNIDPFDCSVCLVNYQAGEGVVLRECLHTFCRTCLSNTVQFSEEAEVKCPYRDATYACDSTLQEREIKALVPPQVYENHLAKSVAQAENKIGNAFHCKTPDCRGWCIFEDNVNEFRCPVCMVTNCLTCQAIHEGVNCRQYQEQVKQQSETNAEARRTKEMLEEMVERGEAMVCPTCAVVLMKKWGCDWLRCSMCKTEICWVTRGPRWGTGGKGDTSGGCQCGVNGIKCHPRCNYCH